MIVYIPVSNRRQFHFDDLKSTCSKYRSFGIDCPFSEMEVFDDYIGGMVQKMKFEIPSV